MTHEEVITMIKEMNIEYAYDHYAEGESPDPPFICFLYPSSNNFGADDIAYMKFNELDIELYTDYKDPSLEESIEEILEKYEIFFEKTEAWIEEEKLYEVLYEMVI